jgi:hypothetical protein
MSANEHPKISVIVPTLNVEALLDNVLSSIARKRCIFSKLFCPTECFQLGLFLIHGEDIFQPPFQNNPKNQDRANNESNNNQQTDMSNQADYASIKQY